MLSLEMGGGKLARPGVAKSSHKKVKTVPGRFDSMRCVDRKWQSLRDEEECTWDESYHFHWHSRFSLMEGFCSVTSFAPIGCTLPSCLDGSCTSIESLDDRIMCKQVASLFRMLFGSALNRALVNRRCQCELSRGVEPS